MVDLLDFKSAQIVGALIADASVIKPPELFGVGRLTVSTVMTEFEKVGKNSSLRKNFGRNRKLSDWDRWTLMRIVKKDYKNKAPKITTEFNDQLKNQVSPNL